MKPSYGGKDGLTDPIIHIKEVTILKNEGRGKEAKGSGTLML